MPDHSLQEDQAIKEPGDSKDPLIGKVLNEKYRMLELIGSGGWGSVYRALHLTLNIDLVSVPFSQASALKFS
jgi:hypothetical protein